MITLLYRIIKNGWQIFWRNRLVSGVAVAVLTLAILTFSLIILFHIITTTATKSLEEKIDISVYFAKDTPEFEIFNIKQSIESLNEVARVEYVSSDEALKRLMAKYGENEVIVKSLEVLENNPLQSALNIKAKNSSQYGVIAEYFNNEDFKKNITKINYAQNKMIIDKLSKIVDTIKSVEIIIGILLILIAATVVFNTIRLVIYSSKDELEIMRLVGAYNIFIRGPYIAAAIFYGLAAAVISFLILIFAAYYISPYVKVFIPEMNLWQYLISRLIYMLGLQAALGIVLASVSSFVATRKHLKI